MIDIIKTKLEKAATGFGAVFACLGVEELETFIVHNDRAGKPLIVMDPVDGFSAKISPETTGVAYTIPIKLYFLTGFDPDKDSDTKKDKALGEMAKLAGDMVRSAFLSGDGTLYSDWEMDGAFIRKWTTHLLLGASIEIDVSIGCNSL